MSSIGAGIAAQVALTQQAVALEVLKQNVEMQQKIASVLQDSIASVPVSGSRGSVVDFGA